MSTVAAFEQGCFRRRHAAPWREYNEKNLRASYVFLNPPADEVAYINEKWEWFKKAYNIPVLVLGEPLGYRFPPDVHRWCDGIWGLSSEFTAMAKAEFGASFAPRLLWERLWPDRRKGHTTVALAHTWGDRGGIRMPGLARSWAPPGYTVKEWPESCRWQDLEEATNCDYYFVAPQRETVPYDVMIAAAKGATIVVPDHRAYTWIPGRKIIYPARDAGGGLISWNQPDVASLVSSKLKRWQRRGN